MFKISGHTISLTRGDSCTITLKVSRKEQETGYIFKPGDIIEMNVYKKKELDHEPLMTKSIEVTEDTNIVDISLSSSDTTIGEMSNKPIEYWYEIQLNREQTIIGYDDNGPKLFMLYPEGEVIR